MVKRLYRHIPGVNLAMVVIGHNPVLGERVARNPRNVIGGLLGLIPGGTLLFDRLEKSGAIESVFEWVEDDSESVDTSASDEEENGGPSKTKRAKARPVPR